MDRILAAIILFNPDIKRLAKCLRNITPFVEQVFFVDNASRNANEIESFVNTIPKAILTRNDQNQGLSKPFNNLINFAKKNNFSQLLLLDQDSEPSENYIKEFRKYISKDYVCLVPLQKHKAAEFQKLFGIAPAGSTEVIKESINSGTLININELPTNVFFDENFFVDWIDIDFFHQLRKEQKKILRVNTAQLLVDIGHQEIHHFFNHTWFSSGYSAFRLEKQAKDTVYFCWKNRNHSYFKGHVTFILWRWLMMLLFEKNKVKKTFAIISGLIQGHKHCKKIFN